MLNSNASTVGGSRSPSNPSGDDDDNNVKMDLLSFRLEQAVASPQSPRVWAHLANPNQEQIGQRASTSTSSVGSVPYHDDDGGSDSKIGKVPHSTFKSAADPIQEQIHQVDTTEDDCNDLGGKSHANSFHSPPVNSEVDEDVQTNSKSSVLPEKPPVKGFSSASKKFSPGERVCGNQDTSDFCDDLDGETQSTPPPTTTTTFRTTSPPLSLNSPHVSSRSSPLPKYSLIRLGEKFIIERDISLALLLKKDLLRNYKPLPISSLRCEILVEKVGSFATKEVVSNSNVSAIISGSSSTVDNVKPPKTKRQRVITVLGGIAAPFANNKKVRPIAEEEEDEEEDASKTTAATTSNNTTSNNRKPPQQKIIKQHTL